MKKFSKTGQLNLQDWVHGFIVAGLSAGLVALQEALSVGLAQINWNSVAGVAIAGGLGYIIKQLGTGIPKEIQIDSSQTKIIKS